MENSPVEWRNAVRKSTERQERGEEIGVIALTAGDLGIAVQVDEMVRILTSPLQSALRPFKVAGRHKKETRS